MFQIVLWEKTWQGFIELPIASFPTEERAKLYARTELGRIKSAYKRLGRSIAEHTQEIRCINLETARTLWALTPNTAV